MCRKKNNRIREVNTIMKAIKWIYRIIGLLIGIGMLAFFVWLGVNIGQWTGLL